MHQIGEHYLAPEWKQELMTIGELLERSHASAVTSATRPYLAQHALFDQVFPRLSFLSIALCINVIFFSHGFGDFKLVMNFPTFAKNCSLLSY